jgi:signal transduction histidine kinase
MNISNKSSQEILKKSNLLIFKELIQNIPNIKSFMFIGEISPSFDKSPTNYQVFCKYNKQDDQVEMLLNDISKYKLNEEKLNFKTLFLSKIAHEFKNPLLSMTELVNQSIEDLECLRLPDSERKTSLQDNFEQIKSLSDFLLILIKDLNQFSESQLGQKKIYEKKETNLNEVIRFCENITVSLLKKVNKNQQVEFKKLIDPGLPNHFFTNEGKLKQAIVNLLSNAVKFTYYGQISLFILQEGMNFIKFSITDSGTGIKEEQQNKLFQPFQKGHQLDNEFGSGLGLSIVKEIITKLGGEINVKSEPNFGTEFWFCLPLRDTETKMLNDIESYKSKAPSKLLKRDSISIVLTNESAKTVEVDEITFDKNLIKDYNLYNRKSESDSQNDTNDNKKINKIISCNCSSGDTSNEIEKNDSPRVRMDFI